MQWNVYYLTAEEYSSAMYYKYLLERRSKLLKVGFIVGLCTVAGLLLWLLFFILEPLLVKPQIKRFYRKRYEQDLEAGGPFMVAFDDEYLYFRYKERQLRWSLERIGTVLVRDGMLLFGLGERGGVAIPLSEIGEDFKSDLCRCAPFAKEFVAKALANN